MTQEERSAWLSAVKERAANASPAPWEAVARAERPGDHPPHAWRIYPDDGGNEIATFWGGERGPDAAFCASARADVPALLAEIERLEKEYVGAVDRGRDNWKALRGRLDESMMQAQKDYARALHAEKDRADFAAAIVAAEGNEGCGCCSDPACSFCSEPGIPGKIAHKPACIFLRAKAAAT